MQPKPSKLEIFVADFLSDCTEASGGCGGVQVFPERTSTDLGFQALLVADFDTKNHLYNLNISIENAVSWELDMS